MASEQPGPDPSSSTAERATATRRTGGRGAGRNGLRTPVPGGESPSGRARRPTSADVARRAGLSRATVSYVLNNTPHQVIPEATRQRVLSAAADLGYLPSAAARTLSSGRSDVVVLLMPDWPIGPTVGSLLEHLSTALDERGFTFLACPRAADRPVSDVWKSITPAAVVTFEELSSRDTELLASMGTDVTLALSGGGRQGGRAMDVPEQRTGRLQAEHLAARGHTRLGYAWPDDPRVVFFAEPRLEGVRQACAELGLAEPEVRTVALDPTDAAEAVAGWRSEDPAVTGVCCYNDEVALAVLAGARAHGLRVPEDLAVVGVDNVPSAAVAAPGLTTISYDAARMARYIAESLTRRLAGQPAPRRPTSDTHSVVVRDSA